MTLFRLLRSSQIICSNLKEFEQIIIKEYLWNSPDQIKIKLPNHLIIQLN
jgi:hypothetical protein